MSKYENLDKFLEKKGKKPSKKVDKEKITKTDFNGMLRADKDELLFKILTELGYVK